MKNIGKVNPDLIKERQKCTFNTTELTYLLDGGKIETEERKSRESFFLDDPELKFKTPPEYLSHKEKYELMVDKSCKLFKKVIELQEKGKAGMENFRELLGGQVGTAVLKDGNPLSLHYVMFITTLMGQGTIEQQAKWIQKAWNLEIIGTYAQTELGHGTFIRGLETISTYDPKTEEFILNSPTLTSYKWWPGGLGHSANYAVVVAQLYIKGKHYGIHPFIVQLRDEDTHIPMPGIKIGEIGHKLGMNATNNGYLGFTNVRIPRKQLLMKNNQVLKDGTFVPAQNSKLTYGTMMFVRVCIVQDASSYLKKAVTIAIRYSAVRHQSELVPGQPEPQILDYVTQQHKLFPLIATFFAYHYSANLLWDLYNTVTSELEAGDLEQLPELHALACCMKAVSSADAALGVETCRLACGGHGYMTCSNLPTTYGLVTAMCTYEGENTVMLLQTARYLMKSWQILIDGGKLTPTLQYLESCKNKPFPPFEKSTPWIISALQKVAAGKMEVAYNHLNNRLRKGLRQEIARNETSIELAAASEAHCRAFVVNTYFNTINSLINMVSEPLKIVLLQLVDLYAVFTVLKCTGDLLRFTNVNGNNIDELQNWLEDLLAQIRPNAVGLVDSFDIRDEVLSSALGSYDGNVYERLFAEAQKSPLNAEPVNKSFHKFLKPLLKSNL